MRYTHTIEQTSNVARFLFAGFLGLFSTSIDEISINAEKKECYKNYQSIQIHRILHKTIGI